MDNTVAVCKALFQILTLRGLLRGLEQSYKVFDFGHCSTLGLGIAAYDVCYKRNRAIIT